MTLRRFSLLALVSLTCLLAGTAQAREYLARQVIFVPSFEMMGQKIPARTDTAYIWTGDSVGSFRTADSYLRFLVNLKTQRLYVLDDVKKTYRSYPLSQLEQGNDGVRIPIETNHPKMNQLMQFVQQTLASADVIVTPTEETSRIYKWDVTRHDLTINPALGEVNGILWLSRDLPVPTRLYNTISTIYLAAFTGLNELLRQMQALPGIIVRANNAITVFGKSASVSLELVDIVQRNAPPGTFEVPPSYTLEP